MPVLTLRTSARTAMAQGIITDAGNGALLRFYNGATPAALGAPAGTLLGTCTWTGVPIGAAVSGAIDIDEAGATQVAANHVAGTPTFVRILTSGGAVVADLELNAGWTWTGAIATGQNIVLSALLLTMPHA